MRHLPVSALLASFAVISLAGCAVDRANLDEDEPHVDGEESAFTSKDATLLDFEFDSELVMSGSFNARGQIEDHLLYTIGHLNGDRAVGRLDRLELTNVKTTPIAGGLTKVTYHAKLPVAWGSKTNLPTKYDFTLPLSSTFDGYEAFTEKYKHDCVDFGAHDVDTGSMWYYYRPNNSGCQLDAALVTKTTATVTKSTLNTTGKFPEYDKVWADGELNMVAVFGKYEDGATTSGDAGVSAYNQFTSTIARELAPFKLVTTPANVPSSPGVETPDVTYEATLANGKKVKVVALLVDNVRTAGAKFDQRYEALSTKADLIAYNGHAGLGDNVRALAKKGRWAKGQYLITFMNGCDTFAYVDGSLAETRAAINADDPTGTKYMEIVTNAMPAFFSSMPTGSLALLRGLMKTEAPMTYEQIFAGVDKSQIVVVTGEEDNAYQPGGGGGGGGGTTWSGIKQTATVAKAEEKRFDSGTVQPGKYTFSITGTGDADLYVKVGNAPTTTLYDCRPYKNGSSETCSVNVGTASVVHVMVRGYATSSKFDLVGKKD